MRRHVRYRPLGKPRLVQVNSGLEHGQEAEIVDESTGGMGLRVNSVSGISLGQEIEVQRAGGTVVGTVVRLERDGLGYQIGLQFGD